MAKVARLCQVAMVSAWLTGTGCPPSPEGQCGSLGLPGDPLVCCNTPWLSVSRMETRMWYMSQGICGIRTETLVRRR